MRDGAIVVKGWLSSSISSRRSASLTGQPHGTISALILRSTLDRFLDTMLLFLAIILSSFTDTSFVVGHGYVASITVDGKQYSGNPPYGNGGKLLKQIWVSSFA